MEGGELNAQSSESNILGLNWSVSFFQKLSFEVDLIILMFRIVTVLITNNN